MDEIERKLAVPPNLPHSEFKLQHSLVICSFLPYPRTSRIYICIHPVEPTLGRTRWTTQIANHPRARWLIRAAAFTTHACVKVLSFSACMLWPIHTSHFDLQKTYVHAFISGF